MAEFSYIHIAYRGEETGVTRTLYSYSPAGSDVDPRWATSTVKPEAAIKLFLNATECYVLQSSPVGHYISLITRHTLVPAKGYVMISVLVDNGCSLTGRQTIAMFNSLKKLLIEDGNLTDEAVDDALMGAGIPKEPVKLEAWTYHEPAADKDHETVEAGYRTFISQKELEAIFSFPSQPEYEKFRCLLVVSATTSLRPGVKLPRVTTPIRKQYGVECPEGVTASSILVYDGDRLTLTYTKEGYGSHVETVTVGSPAAYTKYEGPKILIRTAAQTGIQFIRKIPVKVVSANGEPLIGYTLKVNGHYVNTMDANIDFTEQDLVPGTIVEIEAASNNYQTLKMDIPAEEMLTTEQLTFELKPLQQEVTLDLNFGDNRRFEVELALEKSSQEYVNLRAGSFHGFRVHKEYRDDREIYEVDIRAIGRHTEALSATSEKTVLAPAEFENVSEENVGRKPVIDTKLPTKSDDAAKEEPRHPKRKPVEITTETPADQEDDDDFDEVTPFLKRKSTKMALWGILVVLAVVLAAIFIPRGEEADVDPEIQITQVNADGTPAEAPVQVAPPTPEEQTDIDYLNNNGAWTLSSLKSPMGLALVEALTNGDLNAIASNDYFAVKGRCTNGLANEVVDYAWKAFGSGSEAGNRKKIRNAAKTGTIDLGKLSDDLAKVRPSENINEQPRPQK